MGSIFVNNGNFDRADAINRTDKKCLTDRSGCWQAQRIRSLSHIPDCDMLNPAVLDQFFSGKNHRLAKAFPSMGNPLSLGFCSFHWLCIYLPDGFTITLCSLAFYDQVQFKTTFQNEMNCWISRMLNTWRYHGEEGVGGIICRFIMFCTSQHKRIFPAFVRTSIDFVFWISKEYIKHFYSIVRVVCSLIESKLDQSSQPAFTCSKLTIEALEQGVKYVQS